MSTVSSKISLTPRVSLLERMFSISWFSTYEIQILPDLFSLIQSAAVELRETGFRLYGLYQRWWVQEFISGLVSCSLVCLDWHGCLTCCNQSMGTFNDWKRRITFFLIWSFPEIHMGEPASFYIRDWTDFMWIIREFWGLVCGGAGNHVH